MLFVVLLALLLPLSASGEIYHVSNGGTGTCTTAKASQGCNGGSCARATINAGIQCMARGDELHLSGGTYRNQCIGDSGIHGDVTPPAGFSWGSPTTIRNKPGEVVWLEAEWPGTNNCPDPDSFSEGMVNFGVWTDYYLVFDGININANRVSGQYGNFTMSQFIRTMNATHQFSHGVGWWGSSGPDDGYEHLNGHHHEWLNLWVYGSGYERANPGAHGFYWVAWNAIFDRVTIENSWTFALQWTNSHGGTVQGNSMTNSIIRNNPDGIAGNPNNPVSNTIFVGTGTAGYDSWGGISYHNIFYNNGCGFSMKGGWNQAVNNIMLGNESSICDGGGGAWTYDVRANMCDSLSGDNGRLGCTMTGTASAVFMDAAAEDFRHKPTSPAINQGVVIAEVPFDRSQPAVARGSQPDLGAFEAGGATSGPATALRFGVHPTSTGVGQAISPDVTVQVVDAGGTQVTSTVLITLTLGGGCSGTFGGDPTQNAVNGLATFPGLTVSPAQNNCRLVATSAPLTSATSNQFNVTAPAPAFLAFDVQPSTTVSGITMTPAVTVTVRDASFQLISSTIPITVALQQNPAGGTLSGTLTRNAVAGVATFNNLSVATVGSGYTLGASTTTPGVGADQSEFFAIMIPPTSALTPPIKVDQFGYLPTATKVAVLSNPQTGFNATDAYTPPATLTVKTSPGDTIVFTGARTAWNGEATHAQSGDQLWWFDFSSVTTPGNYYIHDATNLIQSDVFAISGTVYQAVLTAALRMFYYQRSGVAKTTAFAGANWTDNAAFLGPGQDTESRSVTDQGNAGSARDLRGGWFDAGDYNKYTIWGAQVVSDLLTAYQQAPTLWTDTIGIPESGNGLPDIIDEAKWELDWLLRMQATTGDWSVLSKVSVLLQDATSPPSADTRPRYWGAASTTATASTAAAFAQGAIVFGALGQTTYAATLNTAAQNAYTWAATNPNVDYPNTGFATANPDGCITTADSCNYPQLMERLRAAIYLYGLTGSTPYKTFVEANYTASHALEWGYWYAFERGVQDALLYYASLPGATAFVKTAIQNAAVGSIGGAEFVTAWTGALDGYRAYLKDGDYTWGSNQTKGIVGTLYTNLIAYGLNSGQHATYRTIASAYLHYLHGVNPLGIAYLTRMGGLGAERSANEMYHSWFADGTEWDNALTSPKGPPPGFVTGGPQLAQYTGQQTPPLGQPLQKAYKDWNGLGPAHNSYEITEPAIYYQSAYLRLLSQLVPVPTGVATSLAFVQQPTGAVAGAAFTPPVSVRVLDATGQVVPGSTLPVTIALAVNPAGGTLSGTLTQNAVAGVATFNNLSIATVGTGYRLGATTTGGVTGTQSDLFAITSTVPPVTDLTISTFTTGQFLR